MKKLVLFLVFTTWVFCASADPLGCLASRYLGRVQPGPINAFSFDGERALYYYGDGGPRLGFFDVQNPVDHVLLGSISLPDFAADLEVRGNLVYVAYNSGGMGVFRLGPQHNFELVSEVELEGHGWGIELVGDVAYVTDGPRLQVIDICDPEFPVVVDTEDSMVPSILYDLAYAHDALYAGSDRGVIQFNVVSRSKIELGEILGPAVNHTSLVADGNYLYLAARTSGLMVFDVANPLDVILVAQLDTLGDTRDISVFGDRVFSSEREHGFSVIDISDPLDPNLIGEFFLEYDTFASAVDPVAELLYIALLDGSGTLEVIDISATQPDPVLGSLEVINRPWSLQVLGNTLFDAEAKILRVVDVSDPGQMQEVGFLNAVGSERDVAVLDSQTVVLAVGGQGIQVVDITDPASPTSVGGLDFPGFSLGVTTDSDVAFVAARQGGVASVSLQSRTTPILLDSILLAGDVLDVDAHENLIFAAAGAGGFAIIDAADPDSLSIIGSASGAFSATVTCVSGAVAIVGTAEVGCLIYDVSDPTTPIQIGEIPINGHVRDTAFYEGVLYISADDAGLYSYSIFDPESPELLGNLPIDGILSRVGFGSGTAYVGVHGQIYALDVSSNCGSCPADLNDDGALNFFDVSAFLVGYLGSDPIADWNSDGVWNFFDVSGFLVEFQNGCP